MILAVVQYLNDGMGLGIRPDAVPVMKLGRAILPEQLDQGFLLLLGHPYKGAGEADSRGHTATFGARNTHAASRSK